MAPATLRKADSPDIRDNPNPIPSSSPAFGTPIHPIIPHSRRTGPTSAAEVPRTSILPIGKVPGAAAGGPAPILPILLPPTTLRPLAFRTFTKKHNLTLSSSALGSLASFIGRNCGSKWREEGLAERVLEEVARTWKKGGGGVIVDAEGEQGRLKAILKSLEGVMSGGRVTMGGLKRETSFGGLFGDAKGGTEKGAEGLPEDQQTSFGVSRLEIEDTQEEEEDVKDARSWLTVLGAFEQPKMIYHVGKKHFERSTVKPSLFPPPSHKTELFRQRYHLVHQRVLRNEAFQTTSFSQRTSQTAGQTNRITPIANLLGRNGTTHLLLGLLTVSPTGTLTLSDLSGTIALDLQHARAVPEDGAWFSPGMIVLIDGTYEEDYSNPAAGSNSALGSTGGIGGTIGGKFIGFTVGHPPCEKRAVTLGTPDANGTTESTTVTGPAFGWTDFLGLGSERATGARMRRLEQKLIGPDSPHQGNAKIAIAAEVNLDIPATLTALRTMLGSYSTLPVSEYPLAIVLMGNFIHHAAMAGAPGAGSIEYKDHFNALASVLADFPELIARTTLVFVPGDNDAWPSAFSGGASTVLPRKAVPELFTNRIRRVIAEANREIGTGKKNTKEGEAVWTTNPARLNWFGVQGEMVLMRDDICGRLRRTAVRFRGPNQTEDEGQDADMAGGAATAGSPHLESQDEDSQPMDVDGNASGAGASASHIDPDVLTARRLTRTLLDQSYLSPFPISTRPLHWDFAHSLNLYPLPTALILADSEAPPFSLNYFGCAVMNPGTLLVGKKGGARWVEFDILAVRGRVRVETS